MKEIKIKSANESYYTFKTPNNLPVYMWTNNDKNNIYMALVVKYGSTDTKFKVGKMEYTVPTGTAHYLEHLKFHLKDVDASNLFYDMGCDSNAYTSFNETCYEVYCNQNEEEAVKLLLDFVYDNYFTKKLVENERGIILEEANANKDDPDYLFYRESFNNFFSKSNYKYPVIGLEKDIKNISIEDISLVHNFFYRPENMFLIISGNFDKEKMEKTIKNHEKNREFKDIGKVKVVYEKEPKKIVNKHFELKEKNCVNTCGKFMIKTSLKDYKKYSKDEIMVSLRTLLNNNFGLSSDFYEEIIQDGLATRFGSNVTCDNEIIGITFNVESNEPEKVFDLVKEKLKNLKITTKDLKRIVSHNTTMNIMRYDNIYSVASSMIAGLIDRGDISDKRFEILTKLTPKKIMDIYSCVDIDNSCIGILKPQKKRLK